MYIIKVDKLILFPIWKVETYELMTHLKLKLVNVRGKKLVSRLPLNSLLRAITCCCFSEKNPWDITCDLCLCVDVFSNHVHCEYGMWTTRPLVHIGARRASIQSAQVENLRIEVIVYFAEWKKTTETDNFQWHTNSKICTIAYRWHYSWWCTGMMNLS